MMQHKTLKLVLTEKHWTVLERHAELLGTMLDVDHREDLPGRGSEGIRQIQAGDLCPSAVRWSARHFEQGFAQRGCLVGSLG